MRRGRARENQPDGGFDDLSRMVSIGGKRLVLRHFETQSARNQPRVVNKLFIERTSLQSELRGDFRPRI